MNSFENANRLLPSCKKQASLKHTFLRWIVILSIFFLICPFFHVYFIFPPSFLVSSSSFSSSSSSSSSPHLPSPHFLFPLLSFFSFYQILFLGCFALIGDSYSFDNPQAIQTNIEESLQITRTEFNLLYSVVSIPNTVMPFFGGFLLDLFGVRICMLFFSGLLIIGQLVFTYGGYLQVKYLHYFILNRQPF